MSRELKAFLLAALLLLGAALARADYRALGYLYLSPLPGAEYSSPQTRFVLVRLADTTPSAVTNLATSFITVTGATSGNHPGQTHVASDGRTISFSMTNDFSNNELVTVAMNPQVRPGAGGAIAPYQYQFMIAAHISDSRTFTARGDNPPDETKDKAFDHNSFTKWLDFAVPDGSTNFSWIQLVYPGSDTHVAGQYAITSANDMPDRDPMDWHVYGVDEADNLFLLDTRTGEAFANRFQRNLYSITNTTAYRGYRLEITRVKEPASAKCVQLAELEFIEPGGGLLREYWTGISGTAISDLTGNTNYPGNPSGSDQLASFEAITDWADNYGTRVRGYITAPNTGDFLFWLASAGCGELWLSTDDLPANRRLIASVPGWTNSREWNKYSAQKSVAIHLTAGQKYYIEALQKAAEGKDDLAVGWSMPGQSTAVPSEVIPGAVLSPWTEGSSAMAPANDPKPQPKALVTSGQPGIMPNGVSVPSDFPQINVTVNDNPDPNYIFIDTGPGAGKPYNVIFDNTGSPIWYQLMPDERRDMKVQPNGALTMMAHAGGDRFIGLDTHYRERTNYWAVNGYRTDEHELQVLAGGNYLLIGVCSQTINMSQHLFGGYSPAWVAETVLQEFTSAGELIFQWRAWDQYDVRELRADDPLASSFRFPHMNAIEIDTDGHILLSCRHLSEVTKINRDSGQIIWRLGGAHSDFTFVDDSLNGFECQHSIRVAGTNRYILFDNGNFHNPPVSRAVEYELNLTNMTARVVWQYPATPTTNLYSYYMGNVQRLTNGNTLINWALGKLPKLTEVRPDGTKAFEMNWAGHYEAYRVWRCPWNGIALKPNLVIESYPENLVLLFNKFGDTNVAYYRIYGDTNPAPTTVLGTCPVTMATLNNLQNQRQYYFRVIAVGKNGLESDYSDEQSVYVNIIRPGQNMIANGDFSQGSNSWIWTNAGTASATWNITNGASYIHVASPGTALTDLQLKQAGLRLVQGSQYVLEFDAWSSAPRLMEAKVGQNQSPWTVYKLASPSLNPVRRHFSYPFVMTNSSDFNARLMFNVGASLGNVCLANVSLAMVAPGNLETNLSAPVRVTASTELADGVHVGWMAVAEASHYLVFRSDTADGPKVALSSNWLPGLVFVDTTAIPVRTFYYWVKAGTTTDGARGSEFSSPATGSRALPPVSAPQGVIASDGLAYEVMVRWNAVPDGGYYQVNRSDAADGAKTPLGTWQTNTTFSDTSGVAEEVYYYWVKAAASRAGDRASDYSTRDAGSFIVPDLDNPLVSVGCTPPLPIETQLVTLLVNASDNRILKRVTAFWDDGIRRSNVWDIAGTNQAVQSVGIGSFVAGQQISFWAIAEDPTGNRSETAHQTVAVQAETVSTPLPPSGSSNGLPNEVLQLAAGGSSTSLGAPLEYQFDWQDGPLSAWGGTNQGHAWPNEGVYFVRTRARSQTRTNRESAWSAALVIGVAVPPVITNQPQSTVTNQGATVTFVVGASGSAPMSYQWLKDGTNLVNGGRVSGATSNVLTLAGVQVSDEGIFAVFVSNARGSDRSLPATLRLLVPPVISSLPRSATNIMTSSITFSVTATGSAPLRCAWRKDGAGLSDGGRINGASGSMLTITNLAMGDAGNYDVVIANGAGSATSTPPAILIVRDTLAPSLSIASHTNLQWVPTTAVTLTGSATDAGRGDSGVAAVRVNAVRATSDTATGAGTANWSRALTLSAGTNTIRVVASDARGNSVTNTLLLISDTTKPTVTITAPRESQRWSNAVFAVSGTAKDTRQVAAVRCQTNGVWGSVSTTNGWTNWTVGVALVPGANTVRAYAVDAAGNKSPTNSLSFVYVPCDWLKVLISGRGSVSPNYSNAWLAVGRTLSMTAMAGAGYLFSNWTGGIFPSAEVLTNQATLKFMMQSNLILQANFISNPFIPLAGTYQGLFFDTNEVEQSSSGFFNGTVSSNGLFTAKLQQGATSYPLSGQFSLTGAWFTNSITGASNLSARLQLDVSGQDGLTGVLSNAQWTAQLTADRAVYSNGNPAPQAGKYTLVMPGRANSAEEPGGVGFGSVNVATNGSVTFVGTLGDGTKVTQSSIVSKQGQWPLYTALYSGKGSLLGWLTFTNDADRDIDGGLNWIKPAGTTAGLYRAGFTNELEAVGSGYVSTNGWRTLNLTNGVLILEGGNLAQALTNSFVLATNNALSGTNLSRLAITNTTGLFSGTLTNPATGKAISISGAVMQKLNAGYGCFLGTNQSGWVYLGPVIQVREPPSPPRKSPLPFP